jgi:hypothetical protein
VPNEGGDPREPTQLVAAINQAGDAGKLKIAAFDDTPASMTDKKNQIKHGTGGYSPTFDISDKTGAGEGGYQSAPLHPPGRPRGTAPARRLRLESTADRTACSPPLPDHLELRRPGCLTMLSARAGRT